MRRSMKKFVRRLKSDLWKGALKEQQPKCWNRYYKLDEFEKTK